MVDKAVKTVHLAAFLNDDFTDAIYELVKAEAIRLQLQGLSIVDAGEVAAYFATLPIAAIAAGGKKGLEYQIEPLCNNFIYTLKRMGESK